MNYNDIDFVEEQFEKGYERYVRKLNKIKLAKGKTKEGKQNAKLQLQRRLLKVNDGKFLTKFGVRFLSLRVL